MDRDNRWDRIAQAYSLLTEGQAQYSATSPAEALQAAYARDENDEFVLPTTVVGDGDLPAVVADNDAVLFMNFRADRARELTRAFVEPGFSEFERRQVPDLADFVMTTEYAESIKASCAFPPEPLTNVLGDYLAQHHMTQLRIAETEKYAHVTFFFSGGQEQEFEGEDRILVPSPDVPTYDLQPQMSAVDHRQTGSGD
jgi:2,3-bisphosphoglycerate-independent phosphoglycerate mutase